MGIKQNIQSLDEISFIDKILIPLFVALGSKKVVKFHGIDENGIDIYFSHTDIFGNDTHCGILVKKGDIAKSGKNDIREIKTQIEEAIIRKFINPLKNIGEVSIQEFWVICSGCYNDNAKEYLHEMCMGKNMPFVKAIDIDDLTNKIVGLIRSHNERHFSKKGFEQYEFSTETFFNLCDQYKYYGICQPSIMNLDEIEGTIYRYK